MVYCTLTDGGPEAGLTENPGKETKYECIDLGPSFGDFFARRNSTPIRSEYRETLSHTTNLSDSGYCEGAVLIGQPGIEKTIFLYYVLVCRVLKGQVTAFENKAGKVYLFGQSLLYGLVPKVI